MKLGTVISINLSDSNPNNFNSILVSLQDRASTNTLRCFPLNPNLRHIPILGEQVYVVVANSDEASASSQSSRNYYISIVGLQKNVNHNALPKLTNREGKSTPNFSQVFNGIPLQSSTDSDIDFGNGFIEDSSVSQLQPFIGDIIHEGRYGQSIRFGYTPNNVKTTDNKVNGATEEPSWKSDTPESPITIIRNGGQSSGYNKFVIEDINEDDSSIWLGSKQTIGLKPSNGFSLGVTPQNVYKNSQIVINSDRIVLNSKSDSVLISGKKSVNVSTPNWKADMDIIFSQLEAITDALTQLAPQLTGATVITTGPIPTLAAAGPKLAAAAAQIKTQLTLMKQ